MAYTNVWDETAPLDTSLASLLGQDIRTFKTDIRERVEQMSGTLANRPTPEAVWARLLYFAIDTGQIFQWTGPTSGTEWVDITSFFIKPTPPVTAGAGLIDVQTGVSAIISGGQPFPQTIVSSSVPALTAGSGVRITVDMSSGGVQSNPLTLGISYGTVVLGTYALNIGGRDSGVFTLANLPGSQTSQVFFFGPVISGATITGAPIATPQNINTAVAGTISIVTQSVTPTTVPITVNGWMIELV